MPWTADSDAAATNIAGTRAFFEALARGCDSDVEQIEVALAHLAELELDEQTLDGFQSAQEDAQRAAARCRTVIVVLNARHHQMEEAVRATPDAARVEFYEEDCSGPGRAVARLVPARVRLTLAEWRERMVDARSAPPWTLRTGSWNLTDGRNPAGVPGGLRGVPGPWWRQVSYPQFRGVLVTWRRLVPGWCRMGPAVRC
ncbi:MAG TPA: hypothetical protein VJT31_34995 [Rugosimonospora sp.]|nr:hypothetical protein [Rugosimonospora sp.]